MTVDPAGNVGASVRDNESYRDDEIVRNAEANFVGTSYATATEARSLTLRARGTSQTPSAVLAGGLLLQHFGATWLCCDDLGKRRRRDRVGGGGELDRYSERERDRLCDDAGGDDRLRGSSGDSVRWQCRIRHAGDANLVSRGSDR